jgi:hypothetical protein
MEEVKETQPKKKGSAKTKKQKDTEETIVENNEIVNEVAPEEAPKPEPTAEEAPKPETTVEEAPKPEPTVEEAPKPEPTVEEAPKPEPTAEEAPKPVKPVEQPKEDAKPKTETTAKKEVPTIAELRKMRKFNESVFKFSDGFACTATSQRTANVKHNAWLAGK